MGGLIDSAIVGPCPGRCRRRNVRACCFGDLVDLPEHGHVVAMMTRMAADELGLKVGRDVFALIKTVALDERGVAGR